jgi:hypothetical protein
MPNDSTSTNQKTDDADDDAKTTMRLPAHYRTKIDAVRARIGARSNTTALGRLFDLPEDAIVDFILAQEAKVTS